MCSEEQKHLVDLFQNLVLSVETLVSTIDQLKFQRGWSNCAVRDLIFHFFLLDFKLTWLFSQAQNGFYASEPLETD